jgi:hypothetical protein
VECGAFFILGILRGIFPKITDFLPAIFLFLLSIFDFLKIFNQEAGGVLVKSLEGIVNSLQAELAYCGKNSACDTIDNFLQISP